MSIEKAPEGMRALADMEHFVLREGETLILRFKKQPSMEEVEHARSIVRHALPNAKVLVLPPEVEVYAGHIEVFGADSATEPATLTQEDIEAGRRMVEDAYSSGKTVYAREPGYDFVDDWFVIHRSANPHVFMWNHYEYSLTKPKSMR